MDRSRRHSLHADSSNYVITSLRNKIKSIEDVNGQRQDLMDPLRYGAVVHQEQILVNKKSRNVRKVYMADHRYKIGWVVDWDLSTCMVCAAPFGWFLGRPKHHCRACGALVCHGCSPYVTTVPGLNEFGGSRVCINCFGLKPGTFGSPSAMTNGQKVTLAPKDSDTYSISSQFSPSPTNSFSYRHSESFASTSKASNSGAPESITPNGTASGTGTVRRPRSNRPKSGTAVAAMSIHDMSQVDFDKEIDQFEREQLPLYEQDYLKMREFVPIDIYKSSQEHMIEQGLTPAVANRIWMHKALWLICTHKEDIKKIHLADFRGKYSPEGLDVRELRAIWYNLPQWDERSANPLEVGKAEWRSGFKSRMDNQIYKMHAGNLAEALKVNPVYEECELKHVYDPTVALHTRYDRSASIHRNAVESPLDANPYNTAQRLQQQPGRIARGTVRNKTRAYLSNFDEGEEDFESWQGDGPEDGEDAYSKYSGMPEDEDYLYEYEEGDSRLDDGIYDETPPHRAHVPSRGDKRASYEREKESRYNQILSEINAESLQEAELSDLDNDVEDEVTDPYNHRPSGRPGYDAYDGMPPPSGSAGVNRHRGADHNISSTHSVRSTSDHSAAVSQNGDNRSHGSFRYRAPGSAPSHAAHATSHNRDRDSSRQSSFSSSTTPLASTAQAAGPVASPYYATSPVPSQVNSRVNSRTHSPVPAPRAPAVAEPVSTRQSLGARPTGTVSPVPSQPSQGARSLVPAYSTAPPAYVYNQPNSFVPKKSNTGQVPPTSTISPKQTPHNAAYFPPSSAGPYEQGAVNSNPNGYSARRLEREQARRMRSAEARALAESQDRPVDVLAMDGDNHYDDERYDPQSPTSSLSSHNNDSQSLSRGAGVSTPVAQTAVQSFAPFSASKVREQVIVTSSEASTDREVSVAPALHTPPPVQHRAAVQDHAADGSEGGENSNSEDEGSDFISDDDMSFNTAEEINTPMLNHHSYQDRDHAPRTRARNGANGATTGRHPRNANTSRKPGAGPVPAFDFHLTKENLFKYLLLGDAKGAGSMLHMLRAADVPVSSVIAPEQASEIMMQSFKEPESLEQAEETLVLLIDTLHANVNHAEFDTGKTLLHYVVLGEHVRLGQVLISRGGDILHEDRTALTPLALNFQRKQEWVLDAFSSSGRQAALMQSGDTERILKLATCLIFAGYSQQAGDVIRSGGLLISAEKASQLLASCRSNFENMKDPIETFELLESLGASVEE